MDKKQINKVLPVCKIKALSKQQEEEQKAFSVVLFQSFFSKKQCKSMDTALGYICNPPIAAIVGCWLLLRTATKNVWRMTGCIFA